MERRKDWQLETDLQVYAECKKRVGTYMVRNESKDATVKKIRPKESMKKEKVRDKSIREQIR